MLVGFIPTPSDSGLLLRPDCRQRARVGACLRFPNQPPRLREELVPVWIKRLDEDAFESCLKVPKALCSAWSTISNRGGSSEECANRWCSAERERNSNSTTASDGERNADRPLGEHANNSCFVKRLTDPPEHPSERPLRLVD
jgi:hypothetical protein